MAVTISDSGYILNRFAGFWTHDGVNSQRIITLDSQGGRKRFESLMTWASANGVQINLVPMTLNDYKEMQSRMDAMKA